MANLFGILTAIVLAISALVAFKNKSAYETNVVRTQEQKDLLSKTQSSLKAAKEVLAALPAELASLEAEVETLKASETAQQKAERELKEESDALTAKIAENKAKLDEVRAKTEKMGDLKELSSKMRATNGELEELTQSITSAEAKLANLTAQDSSMRSRIDATKSKVDSFASGESLPSMKTRIRSIYPNWGFVTLASGNSGGVVSNSTLDVVRGGETIAKLLVTAVETNSSSASIVPDSMATDATLMVGDQVVPSQKPSKPAAK